VREKPLLLGPNSSILGIFAEPGQAAPPERPTFLLLNAGIVHRVGPHRMTVRLARALAQAGFPALRIDLSGIGDSPTRREALDFEASALADIREVCDDLERKYGVSRFVAMGLCSGADNAFQASLRDDRIVGAVLMDGYAYKTKRYYFHHYQRRLLDRERWARLARRILAKARDRWQHNGEEEPPLPHEGRPVPHNERPVPHEGAVPEYLRAFPPREVVIPQLRGLVDRGVRMYWLYTGGVLAYYNYERQFFDAFAEVDFKGLVHHDYFATSNHTFTALESQRELVAAVVGWAKRVF
jgi:hypothetical protein